MPRARKVCRVPGCPEFADVGRGACPPHDRRNNWASKGDAPQARGWAWTRLRGQALERDGRMCVMCGSPATEVDHIIPRSVAPELAGELDNLRSVCKSCHRVITRANRAARPNTR
jgi:5-methylcytosine-specific restriction protein A